MKLSSRNVALIAVFAALYYVLSLITPYVPAVGLPGLLIKLDALMASVFGFVLGPYLGALAAFFGAGLTWILPPIGMNPTGASFLLSPPINALVVGLIFYKRWKWASALFGLLILAFIFLPTSQPLPEYYHVSVAVLWDKVIALSLIAPILWLSREFSSARIQNLTVLFFLISFIGNQADNMWGADAFAVPLVYEGIFNIPDLNVIRSLFVISPFIYPAIRLLQAFLATVVAVPLTKSLKNTKWILEEKSIIED